MTAPRDARTLLLGLEAAVELLRARVEVRVLQDRSLLRRLGAPADDAVTDSHADGYREAGRAVGAIARRIPGESTCLAQALAGQRMLARRRLPNELHLGVASGRELRAHAWLTSGGRPVVGQPRDHTPVIAFTRHPRQSA